MRADRGQAVIEFTLVMPLLLLVALGAVETSYLMLDEHVVTRLARESANLISRDTDLQSAATVLRSMTSRPVNFDDGSSLLVLSVVKRGAASGTPNYDRDILYQRYTFGQLPGSQSVLQTAGAGTFGGPPGYIAINSDTDSNLRLVNKPPNLVLLRGGLVYVAEIFTRHDHLTPLDRFGLTLPDRLYAIAYF
jgi:hypothetical protein